MPDKVDSAIAEQIIAIDLLQKILINYKKLPKANVNLPRTRGRKEQLDTLWNDCRRLHARIVVLVNPEDKDSKQYFVKDEFGRAAAIYEESSDYLNEALDKFNVIESQELDRNNSFVSRDPAAVGSLQLPRISLPKFKGEYT